MVKLGENMKATFRVLAILVLLSLLLACAPQAKPDTYVFLSPNRQHPVVRTMALGFTEACAALKVKCKDYSYDGVDLSQQAVMTDQIIAAKNVVGAIAFVDKAVYEQDKKLIAAGIYTDMIHGTLAEGVLPGLVGWVATDAGDYARRTADFMGDKMGGKGTVAVTQGSLNDVENLVSAEFKKEMNAKYPDIVVLAPEMEGFDVSAAIAKAASIFTAHPEIVAAFGTTGGSPTTWAKAAEQAGKKPGDIIIVGMDYTRPNLDLVKAGWVTALVGQPLYEETYKALEILVAKSKGETVSYANPFPAPIITKADIDKYYGYADRVDAAAKK
jgi:ribose transport system substrate-binding protein